MPSIYDKIDSALKEGRRIQDLISEGLAKPYEKEQTILLLKDTAGLFTNDTFKRKVEKLGRVTIWTGETKDGFVSPSESKQLDPWIALLEEYKDARKVKSDLSSDNVHIQSIVDGEDQHVFITEKGSGEHAHLIIDGGTGEIRIDPKDKSPHDIIKSVKATLELKTGETVQITKTALSFTEPETPITDVVAYGASKDGYFVIEIYNSGDEDLENFKVIANWKQPEGAQERMLSRFNDITDYLVTAHARSLNILNQGTRIYARDVPRITNDKRVKVTISCKGLRSGKSLKKEFDLETPDRYK